MNEYKGVEFYENKSAAQIEAALNTMAADNYQLTDVIERNGRVVTFLVRPREVKPTEVRLPRRLSAKSEELCRAL